MLKSPQLPSGLQVKAFKGKIWGRGPLRRCPLLNGGQVLWCR